MNHQNVWLSGEIGDEILKVDSTVWKNQGVGSVASKDEAIKSKEVSIQF